MTPIVAGMLVDVVALVCVTTLAIVGIIPREAVLPTITLIIGARLAPAARARLTSGGEGSGDGNAGGQAPPAAPATPRTNLQRVALASGVVALVALVPALIASRARS